MKLSSKGNHSLRRRVVNRDGKIYHSLFNGNMILLMEYNSVPSELKRNFQMDMFAVPNMLGFMHVTHFLLKIIYPGTNEFRDCWPLCEKSQERDFRNKATQMLRSIRSDFPNFQFPEIIPSRFLSPGGFWFIQVIWNLTVLAMQVQAKRDLGCSLLSKPSGRLKDVLKPSATKLLRLYTRDNFEKLEKVKSSMRSFMKDFNHTKQLILDQKQNSIMKQREFLDTLEKNEFWNALDENQKQKLLFSDSKDILKYLGEKHLGITSQARNYLDLLNTDLINKQAKILNAVKEREENGHKYVINVKNLADGDCSGFFSSDDVRNDAPEDTKPVRLLDYFSEPLEALKSVTLDRNREVLPFQLKEWERIHKEWEINRNEMSRLELLLTNKLVELNAKCNQKTDFPAEPTSPVSILCASQNVCTSTPTKDKSCAKPLDITPHKKPSSDHYFDETYRELLVTAARKTHSTNSECTPPPESSHSTLTELMERLKKVQLSMKK